MKNTAITTAVILMMALLGGCSERAPAKNRAGTGGTMKCGAGKCGANASGMNSTLAKKRKNILSQMRDDDRRHGCVEKAPSVRALYDCVRDPETGRLTTKCGSPDTNAAMKCNAGKCGAK